MSRRVCLTFSIFRVGLALIATHIGAYLNCALGAAHKQEGIEMSHHLPNPHNLKKNMKKLETEDGIDGAIAGAGVATAGIGTAVVLAGLSVTPVGWAAAAIGGAAIGASGLVKWLNKK